MALAPMSRQLLARFLRNSETLILPNTILKRLFYWIVIIQVFWNLLIFWTTLIRTLYCILETSMKQTNLSFIFLSCLRFWTQMASRKSQQAGQSSERPKVSLAQPSFIVQFVHASLSESKHRPILFAKIMQL